ncbi:MAG: hypothetical protein K1060chlam5_00513 [Candidatus Anoxychlamydiales bacterium]|nr:hypothetical protein [Candidatus Anoxychlamydiales bacterium]
MNLNKVLDYIFPKFCDHCSKKLSLKEKHFCISCLEQVSFCDIENDKVIYLFENIGAINTFLKLAKNFNYLNFSKIISSYIVVKLNKINFLNFDRIIIEDYKFFKKDYVHFIAKDLSKMINIKFQKEAEKNDRVLLISEKMDLDKYEKIKNNYKNLVVLSLIFDVSFNDFNLSG